jgi:REP element-mobilizing transposase RayT
LTCILSCPTIEDLKLQYFITQVTYQRQPWLCCEIGRQALQPAINQVRATRPFAIDAFVLLPDHFHCLWTLVLSHQVVTNLKTAQSETGYNL